MQHRPRCFPWASCLRGNSQPCLHRTSCLLLNTYTHTGTHMQAVHKLNSLQSAEKQQMLNSSQMRPTPQTPASSFGLEFHAAGGDLEGRPDGKAATLRIQWTSPRSHFSSSVTDFPGPRLSSNRESGSSDICELCLNTVLGRKWVRGVSCLSYGLGYVLLRCLENTGM